MIAKYWWVWLVRGILAILCGLAALIMPGIALTAMVLVIGFYAFIEGVLKFAFGLSTVGFTGRAWLVVVDGLLSIALGIAAWVWPAEATLVFVTWIGIWAIVTGILEITAATLPLGTGSVALVFAGIFSILFGIIAMLNPGSGGLGIIWLFGTYAIIIGILLSTLAFRIKSARVEKSGMRKGRPLPV